MSDAIKNLVVAAAVIAIVLVFVVQFRPGTNVDLGGNAECAVEVGGGCAPYSDYRTAFGLAIPPGLEEEQLKLLRARKLVVEGLIEQQLLNLDAKRLGIGMSDEEVARELATTGFARFSLPAATPFAVWQNLAMAWGRGRMMPPPIGPARYIDIFEPKSKAFSYERFQRWVLRRSGKTEKDFKDYQRREGIAARMRELIRARVQVSEAEAKSAYAQRFEKVVVDYVTIDRGYLKRYAIALGDEMLDAFIAKGEEEFTKTWDARKAQYLPSCRQARHILFRPDESNADPEAAKADAKKKALEAKKRIAAGESFADVARELSEDTGTKDEGGSLGCFAQGKLSIPTATKPVDDAAYALEVGKVSDVVETRLGAHLVFVDAELDEEKAKVLGQREVAKLVWGNKESERVASALGKAILAGTAGGKSLEEATHTALLEVLPEAAKADYEAGRSAAAEAEPEATEGEGGAAPEEEAPAPVDDGPPNAWTDRARPQVRVSNAFPRGGPAFAGVEKPTLAATQLFDLAKVGDTYGDLIKLYDGYAVAQLKERQAVDEAKWTEERSEFIQNYRSGKQDEAVLRYVNKLREQHTDLQIFIQTTKPAPSGSAPAG